MRRVDARAVLAGLLAAAGLLLARPASAFWPFTRERPVALPDSATEARMRIRYEDFKVGRDSVLAAPVPAGPADSTAAAAASPPSAPAGGSGTYRASDATGNLPPATSGTPAPSGSTASGTAASGASTAPSTASATGTAPAADSTASAFGAPADSLATAAGGDSANAGPFAGLGGTSGTPPMSPAAAAAAAALALTRGFAPDFRSTLGSTNDNMKMTSDLSVAFNDPTGITLSSSVGYGADLNLNQKTDQRTSNLVNRLDMPLFGKSLRFGMSTNNNRTRQEGGRTISNTATNSFADSRGADASLAAGRRLSELRGLGSMRETLLGWSADLFYARHVGANSRSTIATQGVGAGETRHTDTGSSYGAGVAFDRFKWLAVRARAGTAHRDNKDRLTADQLGDIGSKSDGDTATVDVDMPKLGPIETVKLSVRINEGSDTSVDIARSPTGSQTGVVGSYVLDTHSSLRHTANLSLRYREGPLTVGLSGNAGRSNDSYVIRANAFNATKRYGWTVDSKLDFWKGAALVAKFEKNFADVNQDERGISNPSTRIDEGQRLYVELSKQFTKTLSVKTYGEVQLDQSFYDHEGPQGLGDRDELRERVGVDFSGAIGPNLKAQATLYLRTYDQAFIDPRRSAQSRNETEYIVRPSYAWTITPHVTLRQSFGLASKVLEDVFPPFKSTLNRNHFMRTEMDAELTDRLQMNLNWDYRIQDNGDYVSVAGVSEKFYAPALRTKTDGLGVGMRYALLSGDRLMFFSRQESQRVYNFGFSNGKRRLRSITESGNLAMGLESRFQMRDLKLDCRVVRNRSFNVSLNRKVYYNVDATLSYTF